jgi:hypothetical protein
MTVTATRENPSAPAASRRSAAFEPSTFRESDNSVEVVWTTGAAVARIDWLDGGLYDETLAVDAASVRLDRLQQGGPVLADHIASTRTLVGSVIPGSARIEGGKGYARIRLTEAEDMKDTVQKVREGHLRNVSVGYSVHTYKHTRGKDGARDTMHATDWEPQEISLTPVPADPGAIIRSRSNDMPEVIEADDGELEQRQAPPRGKPISERTIRDLCSRTDDYSRAFERALLEEHAERPFTMKALQERLSAELTSIRSTPNVDPRQGGFGADDQGGMRRNFADALYARLANKEAPAQAREYESASIIDMGRAILERHGVRSRWMRPAGVLDAIVRGGYHTTSDFTFLIDDAGRRYLLDMFRSAPSPLKVLARKRNFPDFSARAMKRVEGPAVLRNVPEHAEYKRVSFADTTQSYKLETYGEIFGITRQALVNDDMGAFADMAMFWARAQAETEASYFTAMIAGNGVVMADGKTLYHADHGNLMEVDAGLSIASLSAARAQFRGIKNLDGVTPANIAPKYLVVGPAKETEAEQVLGAINASQPSDVNPFSGRLELIVDPRISGNSWRLFADPAIRPVLEYGNLEGQEGLFTDTRVGFDVDGVEYKARIDLGVGALDYTGTLKNNGA